jgi:hypothetical protein
MRKARRAAALIYAHFKKEFKEGKGIVGTGGLSSADSMDYRKN